MIGGEISNNTSTTRGGGVYVDSNCTITVSGGTISGNSSSYGGGVYVFGTFIMESGTISGNTASGNGGGVGVGSSGVFTKTGGVIYGINENGTDDDDKPLKNTAQTNGSAIYSAAGPKYRNNTVESGQNLSTSNDDNWTD
jgi:predicted outer membrane repeat protein